MGEHDHAALRDAGEAGRGGVAAIGEELPARNGAGEEDAEENGDDDRRDEEVGERADPPRAEGDQRRRHLVERDRLGDAEIDAGEGRRRRQRDDEAVDAGAHGEHAVDQPAERADQEGDRHGEDQRHAEHLEHAAERDGDEPAERADGDVHLPDAERHHLREADEERDAEAPEHHVDVELGQEVRGEHGEHRAADDDRREQARPFDEEEAAEHGQRCLTERRAA